jgi:site-specific DNA recombinase
MRIAIYVRVSTQRQAQTQTIEQQIERLRAHLVSRGERLAEEDIFRDDGYSGATLRRPGLDRLRDRAGLATFDCVYVTDPDRLARNFVHQVLLIEELQKQGCRVEFLDRPMSHDPHDQLLLQIRGAVAEYERTLIAERTRRGRQHKFCTGQMLPWTRPPYGYRLDPEKPRNPSGVRLEPAEAAVVAEMFAWFLRDGHGLLGLVQYLHDMHVPSPSGKEYWGGPSVRGILTNPSYTGQVYAGRTRYHEAKVRRSATHPIGKPHGSAERLPESEWIAVGPIPAIVTREQFDLVQAKLRTNQSCARRNNKVTPYLLRALVSCGHCGLACQARRVLPHNTYYICTGKSHQVRQRTGRYCDSRFIPAGALDELVWQDLCDLLCHPGVIQQALRRASGGHWLPQQWQARRENLRRGQASLTQQLERLTEAYLGAVMPLAEYQRRRADLEKRQRALARQEEQLSREGAQMQEIAGLEASVEAFCRRVASGLDKATFEQKRQLVELLIDRVVVTGDEVEIRYVIPTAESSEHVRFCHLRLDYFCHPDLVDRHRLKLPIQNVVSHRQIMVGIRGAAELPFRLGSDAVLPHEFGHGVDAAAPATGLQLLVDTGAAVALFELVMDGLDLRLQDLPPLLSGTGRTFAPGVETAGGDLQDLAHQSHRPLAAMFVDEAVSHCDSLTKKAVAFFKMSRSICSRLFSARRRRSSSSRAGRLPLPGKA